MNNTESSSVKTPSVWKRWLPDVICVVVFAVLAFAYFYPADTEGRILYQHDTSAGAGAGQEAKEYLERTGDRTRWTNSLFSGMPTYQLAPGYNSTDTVSTIEKAYHLWLPDNVWYLFVYLLGFYILLRAFNFRQYLAALGSVLWAFSTYFLIIIAAGHLWKVMALAYLPPLIGGIVLAFRGKYLWGAAVTAIFAALEVHANHVQMTYYYLFIILFMLIAYAIDAVRNKQLAHLGKALAACIVGGLLGVMINISNLYHTWQYSQQTMRGGSELVKAGGGSSNGGLDRDYITQWSYGIGETWTLLVPNAKGGSHNEQLKEYSGAMDASDPQLKEFCGQWYPYWGDQPFTAGPVYVGAFVLTLFFIALFVVKGPMKWALLAVTILSILLSWGKNFMGLTDIFIDHVPMYNKFRTVSSILVIAEFTIPLLAMLGLKRIIEEPACLTRSLLPAKTLARPDKKSFLSPLTVSLLLTGGIALLFALMPHAFFGDFVSEGDVSRLSRYVDANMMSVVTDNLSKMRTPVFTADCWRSVIVIAIGAALLWLYQAKRLKALPLVGMLFVLCLVDLWAVNKRYLNDEMFVSADIRQTAHQMTPVSQTILQDKTLDYRVLNFASDTFNENETSYYHKSVGGYHAAKLGRYADLISAYIAPEMGKAVEAINQSQGQLDSIAGHDIYPVINMLNTKYFIIGQKANDFLVNPYAQGNAWFVNSVKYVDNANQELEGLAQVDLRHEAVADKQFKTVLGEGMPQDSTTLVTLDSYEPNLLNYTVHSATGGVLVLSEIYYPGWTATIDGKAADLGRVNYVLRALRVPAGDHKVELAFFPQSVKTTETIAYVSLISLALFILVAIGINVRRKKNRDKELLTPRSAQSDASLAKNS